LLCSSIAWWSVSIVSTHGQVCNIALEVRQRRVNCQTCVPLRMAGNTICHCPTQLTCAVGTRQRVATCRSGIGFAAKIAPRCVLVATIVQALPVHERVVKVVGVTAAVTVWKMARADDPTHRRARSISAARASDKIRTTISIGCAHTLRCFKTQ